MGSSMDMIKCLELMKNHARNKQREEKRFQCKKYTGTPNYNSRLNTMKI